MAWTMDVVNQAIARDLVFHREKEEQARAVVETVGICMKSLSAAIASVTIDWQQTVSGGRPAKTCFHIPTLFNPERICL